MSRLPGIKSASASVAFACVLAPLFAACDLSQAEVVTRSPDPGPAVAGDPDASPGDDGPPGDGPGETVPDGVVSARDGVDAGRDTLVAREGPSSPRDGRSEGLGLTLDGGCMGEAGGDCGPATAVLDDDFEEGINGWISLGIIWGTSADTTTSTTNAVAGPTAPGSTSAYYASGAWQDMTVEVRVRIVSFGQASSLNRAEVYARYQDPGHLYGLGLRADGTLALRRNTGSWGVPVSVDVTQGEWHTLKLTVSGPRDRVAVAGYLDDVLLAAATDTDGSLPSEVGTVGLGIYGETVAVFDDVLVSSP